MSDTDHRFKVGDKVRLNTQGIVDWDGSDVIRLKPTYGIIDHLDRVGSGRPYYDVRWYYTRNGKQTFFRFAVYSDQVELCLPAFNLTLASPVDNIDDMIRLAELVSKATNLDVKIEKVPPG